MYIPTYSIHISHNTQINLFTLSTFRGTCDPHLFSQDNSLADYDLGELLHIL